MSNAAVFWFTGLSGSGKSTLCEALSSQLCSRGFSVQVLDGDELRKTLCCDLTFSADDRTENVRRIICVAELLSRSEVITLVAAITPLTSMRAEARRRLSPYYEIFVNAPYPVCELRDVKGLYKQARCGAIKDFTGLQSVYEEPSTSDLVCFTDRESKEESVSKLLTFTLSKIQAKQSHDLTLKRRTIAVDFDGVVADYNGWLGPTTFGEPRTDVVGVLRTLIAEGWKVIVHTCRSASDIVPYLNQNDIPYHEVNENSDYGNGKGKPVATVYWDDRALKYSGDARNDLELIREFKTWNSRR